jgi:hypothetical protein
MMGLPFRFSRPMWWVVALLAGLLSGLAIALVLRENGTATVAPVSAGDVKSDDLRREVDATCNEFALAPERIRVRQSGASGGEHRVLVDEQFRPLEFHYALSRRLSRWGVKIVGEERPREKKIALRLLLEEKQLWNVQLLIQKSSGKEDRHRP